MWTENRSLVSRKTLCGDPTVITGLTRKIARTLFILLDR